MVLSREYLKKARVAFTLGSNDEREARDRVFELAEAIANARLAIENAPKSYPDAPEPFPTFAKIRSDAGKIEHDAREMLCVMCLTTQ